MQNDVDKLAKAITEIITNTDGKILAVASASRGRRDYDHLFKLVLIGDSGVGKSCLLLRFADGAFTDSFISTIGVDFRFRNIKVQDKAVKLQIWDTAGQERFRTITSAYYRGAEGIIVVYDITHRESFEHVRDWLAEVTRFATPETQILIIGNKSDLEDRAVSTEEGQALADELGVPFIEASAKSANHVSEAFETLASNLIDIKAKESAEDDARRDADRVGAGDMDKAAAGGSTGGKKGCC